MPTSGDVFRARSIARETHASTLLSGLYADVLAELEPWIAALDKKITEARAAGGRAPAALVVSAGSVS